MCASLQESTPAKIRRAVPSPMRITFGDHFETIEAPKTAPIAAQAINVTKVSPSILINSKNSKNSAIVGIVWAIFNVPESGFPWV